MTFHATPAIGKPSIHHVAVLGAGIVGLSTAWRLQRDGFEVTVIDRAQPGMGASAANGAQLSYAYVQPLADPALWAQLPGLLLARQSPLALRLKADPAQWAWGLRFLAACRASVSARSTAQLLALAEESRSALAETMADLGQAASDAIGHRTSGKLVMFSDAGAYASARRQMALQRALGGAAQSALTPGECVALEPALGPAAARYVGGIHTPGEAVADCAALCNALHHKLSERGVRFVLGADLGAVRQRGPHLQAVQVGAQWIEADAFVGALGTGNAALARRFGATVPVYPIKGYSLTLDVSGAPGLAPRVSVTDAQRKLVFARLGGQLRVAGIAEIVGEDTRIDPGRVSQLRDSVRAVFARLPVDGDLRPWVGLRPATPTGLPVIGRVARAPGNLFFNAGHGALGFTLAAGSAARVSRAVQAGTSRAVSPSAARLAARSA